jgi:hypothetical protein
MPISQVLLSDTFGQFRNAFNETANAVNSVVSTTGNIVTGNIVGSTLTANNLTTGRVALTTTAGKLTDDSALTYNTSTDVLTLGGTTDATAANNGTLVVSGGVGIAKKLYVGTDLAVTGNTTLSTNLTVTGNATVTGNLTINGTTTTVNSTTLTVDDKNIELGSVATPTDVTADGGGITLKGATDKTISWSSLGWTSSEDFNLVTGKIFEINGTSVLSATTLGSGVTGSSLTSVGTIATGVWQGTLINSTYGGTGVNNAGRTITIAGNISHAGAFTQTFTATANTSVTLPTSGTLVGSADTGTVTSTMIADGTIVNADINASAAIAVSKLASSAVTVGNTAITLGTSSTTLAGLTALTTVGLTASGNVVFSSTGALKVPSGTTAEKAGYATVGMIRYDTTLGRLEVYKSTGWAAVGGGVSAAKAYFFGNF